MINCIIEGLEITLLQTFYHSLNKCGRTKIDYHLHLSCINNELGTREVFSQYFIDILLKGLTPMFSVSVKQLHNNTGGVIRYP